MKNVSWANLVYHPYSRENLDDGLRPYKHHLRDIKKYQESTEKTVKYTLYPNQKDNKKGIWVKLDEFYDSKIEVIYDLPEEVGDKFSPKYRINVLDHDDNKEIIKLHRKPNTKKLKWYPNTLSIKRQLDAIHSLLDKPMQYQMPLIDLFNPHNDVCRGGGVETC